MIVATKPNRLSSLDGLRGCAALLVVFHHVLLYRPGLLGVYQGHRLAFGSFDWWMAYTPLHLLWAGTEAVFLFFVLSGFVLSLPLTRATSFDWRAYYPARLIRLYLPVWGAIAFGALLLALVSMVDSDAAMRWRADVGTTFSPSQLFHVGVLLIDTDHVNGALWSLRWEILFSMALPLYAYSRFGSLRLKACLAIIAVAVGCGSARWFPIGGLVLMYASIFWCGAIIAYHVEEVSGMNARMVGARWPWFWILTALLLVSHWIAPPIGSVTLMASVTTAMAVFGAVMLVFGAMFCNAVRRFMETGPVQWLGKVSFSLYLVHAPVLYAVAAVSNADMRVLLAVVIPVSLLAAWMFYRLIESPTHMLSKRILSALKALKARKMAKIEARATA